MKANILFLTLILLAGLTVLIKTLENAETCTVTYIANEGFLIESGKLKVMTDALFGDIKGIWCEKPDESVSEKIIKGLPPFDNINVMLVSHKHADHFKESMVIDFLKNNRNSLLVCPEQVNELLKRNDDYANLSGRIISIIPENPFDSTISINSITIRVIRFNHGSYFETDSVTGEKYDLHKDVENLGYIIGMNGFKIFHSGDDSPSNVSQYSDYEIADEKFDIVFLNRAFLGRDGQELIEKNIHTKNLIFMHVEPEIRDSYKSAIVNVPEMYIFSSSLEKRIISK